MKVKKVKKGPFTIEVNEQDPIVLSVTIGNAQIGGNVVRVGSTQIAKGAIQNLVLGTGADLIGKELTVISNVLDVNPSSNKIAITHFYFNGTPPVFPYPFPGEDLEVDADGDVLSLTATYTFKKK